MRQGIFRWPPNAMYVFGFLLRWSVALQLRSEGALVAAAFQHVALWAHGLSTEQPDLLRIHAAS